jgi:hypothetical protein
MDASVFDQHEGPWTEQDHLALLRRPGQERVEVVDGTLLVGPGTPARRWAAAERVRTAVEAALPHGLAVVGPVPLRLGPDCVLVPDLVVVPAEAVGPRAPDDAAAVEAAEPDRDAAEPDDGVGGPGLPVAGADRPEPSEGPRVLDGDAALLVVELVGRDHGAVARTFKPQIYARSRIPYSLLVDHDSRFAAADMIISGRYHEYARTRPGDPVLRIEEPFALELDLRAITAPVPEPAPAQVPSAATA